VETIASRRAPWRRTFIVLAALAIGAAACGGDDGDAGGGDGGDAATGDATTTTAATAEPVRGGTLTYSVEADTSSPWLPSTMVCAAACHSTVGRTIYEPLAMLGTDGKAHPYLLESITANADFTVYTLVARQGIKFHDGTDFNADAIAFNLIRQSQSILVGPAVQPIAEGGIVSDGAYTVTVTMDTPWPAFPTYLNSQLGYMGSPTWIQAAEAASAAGDSSLLTQPVGTGPFQFESYESGDNGRLTATRFEDYWRGDGPNSLTGEGLPYLDGIEVRFTPDSSARSQALLAGDIDMLQSANGSEIEDLEGQDGISVTLLDTPFEIETSYLLINNMPEVAGAPNPMADIRVRRALALATDNQVLNDARWAGRYPPANGPFPPGVIGNLDDTGFPTYDPDAARAIVDEVAAEQGSPVAIAYKTTNDPFNLTTAELLQQMWQDVGFQVTIDQIPQGEFINQALAGNFQVFGWRNHSGVDPDQQFVWWSSTTTQGIALNFGRIISDDVDSLLNTIRTNTDEAARQTAAEDLNRLFAEQVFNVWNNWIYWGLAHADNVYNVAGESIPDAPEGVRAINMGANLSGVIMPAEIFESPPD
jgi:peptide/nickel transport system substrate-binding protein